MPKLLLKLFNERIRDSRAVLYVSDSNFVSKLCTDENYKCLMVHILLFLVHDTVCTVSSLIYISKCKPPTPPD